MSAPQSTSLPATMSKRRGVRIAWAAVAVATLGGVGMWIRTEVVYRRDVSAARRALDAGRPEQAEPLVNRLVIARPNSSETHFLKARLAFARERPQETLEELERARALGHPEPELLRLGAIIMARAGKANEAEPMLRRALDTASGADPEVAEALTRLYFESFRFGPALEVADRWVNQQPLNPKPYLWRAEINLRSDAGTPALIRDYSAALKLDPSLDAARLGLAEALSQSRRYDEAATEFAAYIARKPQDVAGYVGAGKNAREAEDEAEASRLFDGALVIDPSNVVALTGRAAIAMRRGKFADALTLLDKAVKVEPLDSEIHYRRGLALGRLGRRDEAAAAQETAQQLRRDYAEMDRIRKALVRAPRNLDLQFQAARWLIDHGQDEEGLRWARKVLKDDPAHPATCRLLADYYERKGNRGLANYYRMQAPPSAAGPKSP